MRLFSVILLAGTLSAQGPPPGLGGGYQGEIEHLGRQLLQLAEATPEAKFSWRPAPGVMSIGEVYTHIYTGNYMLLDQVGHKPPADLILKPKTKGEITTWLKESLIEVKKRYQGTSQAELKRPVKFLNSVDSTVENVYLRILAHISEHMGQSIAYARMNGIVPPWSAAAQQKADD